MTLLDKKAKKEAIRKKNLKNRLLFLHVERIQAAATDLATPDIDIAASRAAEREKKRKEEEEGHIWSAKTQHIRNRLTNRKRQAAERWNRFAGTEGGGGRGL